MRKADVISATVTQTLTFRLYERAANVLPLPGGTSRPRLSSLVVLLLFRLVVGKLKGRQVSTEGKANSFLSNINNICIAYYDLIPHGIRE